jgi:aspartyl aminopeptidase
MSKKQQNPSNAGKAWKNESGWHMMSAAEERRLEKYCGEYMEFLSACKTERLACASILAMAEKAGFRNLDSLGGKAGTLKAGDRIYRTIDGKTIFLAVIGSEAVTAGLNLVGGHIDCPRLDLKPRPLYQDQDFVLLDTHYYGGIKKYQWLTVPLALYGVVFRRDGSKVEIAIGDKKEDPVFVITDLLPHLDIAGPGKKVSDAFPGERLNLLFGSRPLADKKVKEKESVKANILRLLGESYGIEEEDFASAELEVVPAGAARELGLDRSMILGYGHDDRVCAYASARALFDFRGIPRRTIGALLCDKEEIGSYGRTGMDSCFLSDCVAEVLAATSGYDSLTLRRTLSRTMMLSADVGTLADPAFPDVNSPNNCAHINCGIALYKYNGARGKSGSSDASAEMVAAVRKVFNDNKVAWQIAELGKVDVGGGGTIALHMARLGIQVIDCGVGLLSMHAPWEVAGKVDIYMAYKGYGAFLADIG